MTRLALALVLGALALGGSSGAARGAALLTIDVVALDRRGLPAGDLKPSEFEVWINGFQIPIETVTFVAPTAGDTGRTIVLLLDDWAIPPTVLPRVREAARRFVNRMSAGDQMAIVSLNGGVMRATDDRSRLLAAIDNHHLIGAPIRVEDAADHVMSTVAGLSRQLTEAPGGRKAIVAIGAAWLFDTPFPPSPVRDLRPAWVEAMRATARAHVSLYVIDVGGVGSRPVTGGSSGFARETGGHAFTNSNDFAGAVDRVLREVGTYYVLSVQDPPIGRKGDLREVEVKVLRRGVTVRARRGIPPGS